MWVVHRIQKGIDKGKKRGIQRVFGFICGVSTPCEQHEPCALALVRCECVCAVVGEKGVPFPENDLAPVVIFSAESDHRSKIIGTRAGCPYTRTVGLTEKAKCFAGATVDPHTRTVGHNGRPSGVWGPGGRPRRGRAAGLPFPIAAECAGGAQRVKVEHPPGRRPTPRVLP